MPVFSANPSGPEFYRNPYPFYRKMHALGDVFYWQEYGIACVARHAMVNTLLRDKRLGREITHVMSRKDAGLEEIPKHLERFYAFEGNSMLEREPPVHTRLRKLVNRAFISRNIERMAPEIETLCHRLIDRFADNNEIDLLPAYAEIIPVWVIATLLGVPTGMSDQLLDWSHKMVAMYQFTKTTETEKAAEKATIEFSGYILEIVKTRIESPRDDLISGLIQSQRTDQGLSDDELVATCILLLNAGHEATVHALGNSIHALLEGRCDTDMLFRNEATTGQAIEELLRYDPPLHLFTRYVLEDMEVGGIPFEKGQKIALLLGAANHDASVFENPQALDFSGNAANLKGGQLAFGAGIHFCLGAPLARMEMRIALPVLFARLPRLALSRKAEIADRYHFRGLKNLYVHPSCKKAGKSLIR